VEDKWMTGSEADSREEEEKAAAAAAETTEGMTR
jgi:hypothetical protein